MNWALSGRHLLVASPFLLNPDPQWLAVLLAKRFQIILPLSDVCVQMEQTEKQIKLPNEGNLSQTSITRLLSHEPKQFEEARIEEPDIKDMEQTGDVLWLKAKCISSPHAGG